MMEIKILLQNALANLYVLVMFVLMFSCLYFVVVAIPSLRARDCSKEEKEALNYLFLLIPLVNVILPFYWRSFSVVWSADTLAFIVMYTWKVCHCVSVYY
jgi:hypothetical protein